MELLFFILAIISLMPLFIIILVKHDLRLYLLSTLCILFFALCLIKNMSIQKEKEIQNTALEVYKGNTELIITKNYQNDTLISCDSIVKFY